MKKQPRHQSERNFVDNFFGHGRWEYEPKRFVLSDTTYTPDFYDKPRDTYIEVSGSRQAFFANKDKYSEFRRLYPAIKFEIRNPNGDLLDEFSGKPARAVAESFKQLPNDDHLYVSSVVENITLQRKIAAALKGSLSETTFNAFLDSFITEAATRAA